jgi:hypothetical protein
LITATVTADGTTKSTSFPVIVYDGAHATTYQGTTTTLFANRIDFPDTTVAPAQASGGVQLGAALVPANAAATYQYLIAPMDTNTAQATLTPEGVLTANQPGQVRVTVIALQGTTQIDTRSALVTITSPPPIDTTALRTRIAQVQTNIADGTLAATSYTLTSWAALTVALNAAVAAAEAPVSDAAVAGALTALDGAVGALVPRGDVATLEPLIAAYQGLAVIADSYTSTSWAVVVAAGELARGYVISPGNVTQAQVTAAAASLEAAIGGLVRAVNKTALTGLISAVDAEKASGTISATKHTEGSLAVLENALTAARVQVALSGATQADIDAAVGELQAAVAGLVLKAQTSTLQSVVDIATGLGLAAGDYTTSSWVAYQTALGAAAALIAEPTTQAAVDAAEAALRGALSALVPQPNAWAPGALAALVASLIAVDLDAASYTTASWAAYQAALGQASSPAVRDNPSAAAAALDSLQSAYRGLTARASTGVLVGLADLASRLPIASDTYTADSAAAVATALAQANAVLASNPDTVTEAQVSSAVAALSAAVSGLVRQPAAPPEPDSSTMALALGTVLVNAAGLKAGDYTAATWAVLAAAIVQAETVLADTNASAGDLQGAMRSVSVALAGLAAKPPAADPPASGPPASQPPASGPPASPTPTPTPSATDSQGPLVGATVPVVTSVKLAQKAIRLVKGKSVTVAAIAYTNLDTTLKAASWTSSKPSVASVNGSGKIKAKKAGVTTVTVKAGTKTAKIKVTVVSKRPSKAAVTTVSASGVPGTLAVGASASIVGSYKPATAVSAKITYASSNPAVLTVDKAGRVVAKAAGKATVTVKAGKKSKKYTVTVS